jgi:hypothetical protein
MVEEIFANRLENGERIVWSGRPGQGFVFMPDDAFNVPLHLFFLGVFIYLAVMGWPAFTFWGVLVICISIYWAAGRFLIDARIRRGTYYAITNRRVLFARPSPYRSVRWPRPIFTEVRLTKYPDIILIERRGGRGTIRFGSPIRISDAQYMFTLIPSLHPRPHPLAINAARNVFELIKRLGLAYDRLERLPECH